jgi:hypothetical protein
MKISFAQKNLPEFLLNCRGIFPFLFALTMFFLAVPSVPFASATMDKAEVARKVSGLQVPFIENQGQIKDKSVRFYANTFSGTVFVTDRGELVYNLPYTGSKAQNVDKERQRVEITEDRQNTEAKGVAIKETFNGLEKAEVRGLNRAVTKVSYFMGDKESWKSNISTWQDVSLGEAFENIDMSLRAYGNNVEKLFTVHPQGKVGDIKLKVEGAKGLNVNEEGELEVETELGTIKMTKPVAYQEVDGKRVLIAAAYDVHLVGEDGNTQMLSYGFKVGEYDDTKELVIDPLLASTFIGGSNYDYAYSIALDSSGNVFVTGMTLSNNYPVTPGAYSTSHNTGYDVMISKLNRTLSSFLASTFIGGQGDDRASSIAIDSTGDVYISGYTQSTDYPTTVGAYDSTYNGGYYDIYVSKLDSTLSGLLASTFIGGGLLDYGMAVAIDSTGNVYISGYTQSTDYPATAGAYDVTYNGGENDIFISKFNSTLNSLLASTFIGGGSYESGRSIAIDSADNIYIVGDTYSTNYPATAGAYDVTYNGGYYDIFVSKFNSTLSSLLASTLIGGNGTDYGRDIAIDSIGNVYIVGDTTSINYPVTAGA